MNVSVGLQFSSALLLSHGLTGIVLKDSEKMPVCGSVEKGQNLT